MIHLIVGKWRTPNHSKKKSEDDSHQVKEEILRHIRESSKQQNKKDYRKQVGDNPDIGINDNKIIILKGRGEFKKCPSYVTDILAENYFVLSFISIPEKNEIEIQLMVINFNTDDDKDILFYEHYGKLFIIPNNETVVRSVMDLCFDNNDEKHDTIIIIVDTIPVSV